MESAISTIPTPKRNAVGHFGPGNCANPKGRPKTGMALAEAVRRLVDRDELVQIALSIARGLPPPLLAELKDKKGLPIWEPVVVSPRDRLAALTWLRDTGFGKPTQAIELSQNPERQAIDFGRLDPADVAVLDAVLAKAAGEESK